MTSRTKVFGGSFGKKGNCISYFELKKNQTLETFVKKYQDLMQNKCITHNYTLIYLIFPYRNLFSFLSFFSCPECICFLSLLVRLSMFFVTDFEQLNDDVPWCGCFHGRVPVLMCAHFKFIKLLRNVGFIVIIHILFLFLLPSGSWDSIQFCTAH